MKRDIKLVKYPCGCIAIYSKSLTFKEFREICIAHQRGLVMSLHKEKILKEYIKLGIIDNKD